MKKQKLCCYCAERMKNGYAVYATEPCVSPGVCEACRKKTLVQAHVVGRKPKAPVKS